MAVSVSAGASACAWAVALEEVVACRPRCSGRGRGKSRVLWVFCRTKPAGNATETIQIANWPRELDGLRIAVLSDFHAGGSFIDERKLRTIVERTNELQPEMIVILGDYISGDGRRHPLRMAPSTFAAVLKDFRAPLGVYSVLGNHDWWYDGREVRAALEQNGIKVLDDEVFQVNARGTSFWLVGLADLWTRPQRIETTVAQVPENVPVIAHAQSRHLPARSVARPVITRRPHARRPDPPAIHRLRGPTFEHSPFWNNIGLASKVAGRTITGANVVFSVTAIATAPSGQRAEAVGAEIGAWAGAAIGGTTGAKVGAGVGSFFGPGPGTAIGAGVGTVVGAGAGAVAGSAVGREMVRNPGPTSVTVKVSPITSFEVTLAPCGRRKDMPEFLKELEGCPACRDQFGDHQFSLLASVPIEDNNDPRPTIFQNAIKEHDWRRVLSFQEWAGGYDNYELYGIRAKDHPVVLVIVWDPVELFYNERIVGTEILNEAETKELLSLVANKDWKSCSETA